MVIPIDQHVLPDSGDQNPKRVFSNLSGLQIPEPPPMRVVTKGIWSTVDERKTIDQVEASSGEQG